MSKATFINQASDPSPPAAGRVTIYAKTDKDVYSIDDAGLVKKLTATPEFADDVFRVIGSADATKKVALEVDGLTTGTTRTLTVPDRNFTLGQFKSHVGFGDGSIGTSTTTRFLFPGYRDGTTAHTVEGGVQYLVRFPCTVLNLGLVQEAGVGGGTVTYTVRKNGSNQTLVISGAPTITSGSDVVNSFSAVAGDLLSVSGAKTTGITTSPIHVRLTMELLAS